MALWSVEGGQKGEPNTWKVSLDANIGASEPFVHQILQELPQLVEAGSITDDLLRRRIKESIWIIGVEGLMPALNTLRKIRCLPDPNLPEMERRQLYDELGHTLWRTYKELMQDAVMAMGFEDSAKPGKSSIDFLFDTSAKFKKGVGPFHALYPRVRSNFGDYLRDQRKHWQNDLSNWRNNFLDHPKGKGWKDFRHMYDVQKAEMLFDCTWKAIATILARLIESKLWPGWVLQEIPEAERNPNCPNRFRLTPSHSLNPHS
ncbi:MAG: hypothetical protein ACLP7O_00755 [Terracidiphilus sp.]